MKRKRIIDMSMEELTEFRRECRIYLNDNEQYICENFEVLKSDGKRTSLVQCAIAHYDTMIDGYNLNNEILTRCQKQEFRSIAESYFQ